MNEALIEQFIHEHQLAVEQFTKKQLADLLRQLFASGDIVKYVVSDGSNRQALVYLPFNTDERHRTEIAELKKHIAGLEKALESANAVFTEKDFTT